MKMLEEWKGADTSYLQSIQTHSHQHPSLKLLQALSFTPEHYTRMKILEFKDTGISDVDIDKLPQLDAYWNHTPPSTGCKGHLYLVEDISLPWVSALGLHFNIDPRFFAEYLKFDPDRTQNFLNGYHSMRRLASLRGQYTFATFVYHEARTFEGVAPRREEYEILTRANVTRLVTTVDHRMGRSTGLVRRNLSVWWREGVESGELWDVVILCDPKMSDWVHLRCWSKPQWAMASCPSTPYLDGYLDFSSWPLHHTYSSTSYYPSQSSMLDSIAHYWHNASSTHLEAALSDPKHAPIFVYRIIASNWNLQLEYLISVVSDLEKGLLKFEQMDAHPHAEIITCEVTDLRTLLSDVNSWRRRVYFYLEQMKWNIEMLDLPTESIVEKIIGTGDEDYINDFPKQAKMLPLRKPNPTPSAATTTLVDFQTTLSSLRLTQQRIQSLLPVVMGAFSLLEAQHSVLKADLTIRLSSIALIFVPLSYTATLLSMSGDFLPGQSLFWVYFVVTVPMIIALFWWAYWVQIGRLRRVGTRFWREKLGRKEE